MRQAQRLLTLLTEAFPHAEDSKARHNLCLTAAGKVQVNIHRLDRWHTFVLDNSDLDRDSNAIVLEVSALMAKECEPKADL